MREKILTLCLFPIGTGCLQIPRKRGISGCKNSIKFSLIFAYGNPMLATNLLGSLKLWEVFKPCRGFFELHHKCILRASDLLIAFYALNTRGYVPIFTTCYAVFISFVCKTSTDSSSVIHK